MRVQDLIKLKRDGKALDPAAITELIAEITANRVPDYQVAAMLMAIFWRGMDETELTAWTEAMTHSGKVVDLSSIPQRKVDKHSTGGVGDKVSICLAPLVAACGLSVPMISGRGLGHTGGTLDKLEAIPGFETQQEIPKFAQIVQQCGLSLIGQTDDLAPADRRLYALRDVTATVESVPLISSSIMSKKLAEGIDGLVLDVKIGSGAFMKSDEQGRELARTIIAIGNGAGKRVSALLTDMNQPLGREIGNASETREAIEILKGGGPEDLWLLTRRLAVEMLLLGDVTSDEQQAESMVDKARASGEALERLKRCVELQGGDASVIDEPGKLATAAHTRVIEAPRSGYFASCQTEQVGRAAMLLGAGRRTVIDVIDPAVGLTMRARLGDKLAQGQPLCEMHYNDDKNIEQAAAQVIAACTLQDEPSQAPR
jgi:pyrimidine-nucleoside phosphorylase